MSLTPREKELLDALEGAIQTYQYASMTSWERECYANEMEKAETTLEKFKQEDS
jgi:hypothetical protein